MIKFLNCLKINTLSTQTKKNILWGLFLFSLVFVVINLANILLDQGFLDNRLIKFFILVPPILLLLFHSIWTLSFFRGIMFILFSSFVGLFFEILGVKYGRFFGGYYLYRMDGIKIYGIPLAVILYWAVFIYIGYCLTNSFLYWLGRDKPVKNKDKIPLLLLLILLDGLIVVIIDLFMDPLQVKAGNWFWLEGGPYFGIPVGNFFGWFVVAIISTGIFRIYEYLKPKETPPELISTFIIAALTYGMIYFMFLAGAITYKMNSLVLVGSLMMLPIIAVNLFLRLTHHEN